MQVNICRYFFFFLQAEDGIRAPLVTGVQTCALPIFLAPASLLGAGQFEAAGIDAPFSVPAPFVPPAGHSALLAFIAAMPLPRGRDFPTGPNFVTALAGVPPPLKPAKPLRQTEKVWALQGLATRSTMWVKPRGGAPFTSACIRLLSLSRAPIWPWAPPSRGLVVEAFPAAQLLQWSLPRHGYNGKAIPAANVRATIVAGLLSEAINLNGRSCRTLFCRDRSRDRENCS